MRPHIIQQTAKRDLTHARDWYDLQRAGSGLRFIKEFGRTLKSICQSPDSYPIFSELPFRFAMLKRFPYSVLYEVRNNTVLIYGVLHNAMDEARWLNRLP